MSNLSTVIGMCRQQLRYSPTISDADVVRWLETGIRRFCLRARWLDGIIIIPMKANVATYLLPGDHIATTSAYYDEVRLQRCTAFDSQLVNPDFPIYYHEDDWQDEASTAVPMEFAIQVYWEHFWALQQMHGQNTLGRRTITLVAAPTEDGEHSLVGSPVVGMLEGTVSD